METAVAYKKPVARKGISKYNQNSILNADPTELILKLYDLGIVSVRKGDLKKAQQVFVELIAALNFDYQQEALGFFRLYRYCQECLYKGNTEEPLEILRDLRETWAQAFNLT